jgi:hypothetical protein
MDDLQLRQVCPLFACLLLEACFFQPPTRNIPEEYPNPMPGPVFKPCRACVAQRWDVVVRRGLFPEPDAQGVPNVWERTWMDGSRMCVCVTCDVAMYGVSGARDETAE